MNQVFVFNPYRALPGREATVGAALLETAVKVRAEPDCRYLYVFRSIQQPGNFMVHSCWSDRNALDAFLMLPFVSDFFDRVLPLTGRPVDAVVMHRMFGEDWRGQPAPRGGNGADQVFVFSPHHARPGKEALLETTFRDMALKVRREAGNVSLDIFRSDIDPGQVLVCACWQDLPALEAALKLPYVVRFLDDIEPLIDSPLDVSLMRQVF